MMAAGAAATRSTANSSETDHPAAAAPAAAGDGGIEALQRHYAAQLEALTRLEAAAAAAAAGGAAGRDDDDARVVRLLREALSPQHERATFGIIPQAAADKAAAELPRAGAERSVSTQPLC